MNNILEDNLVAVCETIEKNYIEEAPFHPSENYPEYVFRESEVSVKTNPSYQAVREGLFLLGLDKENFGRKEWNPLGGIVSPGNKVVIKPNFVLDKHYSGGELYSVITHPSIIRAICDYVYIALKGDGEIVIADAPQADCDFDHLMDVTEIRSISEWYKKELGFNVNIYDLRQLKLTDFYNSASRVMQEGDPVGYTVVNLGTDSAFFDLSHIENLYGSDYDRKEITRHHNDKNNEYCIANTILTADVVISVPKMKTHRKAGVTLCMKNLVGINGNKNYLPHFRIGLPEDGGDEFLQLSKDQRMVMYTNRKLKDHLLAKSNKICDRLYQLARRGYHFIVKIRPQAESRDVIEGGGWYGNDTIWRMIVDLNRILLYADKNGEMRDTVQRKMFMFVDGIWAGEKTGPLEPELKKCGIIICGGNPFAVDVVSTEIMGFDILKIPKFKNILCNPRLRKQIYRGEWQKIKIAEKQRGVMGLSDYVKTINKKFKAPDGWTGIVERIED